MTCSATVTVLNAERTEAFCELDAGHDGPHEAHLTGKWQGVMWAEGTTYVRMPGTGRRP